MYNCWVLEYFNVPVLCHFIKGLFVVLCYDMIIYCYVVTGFLDNVLNLLIFYLFGFNMYY